MNWKFWKKPPTNEPIKPPSPPDKDDWVMGYSWWVKRSICHCGEPRAVAPELGKSPGLHTICPRCGHTDKWEEGVWREEHEYSPSRLAFHVPYIRNRRWVKWAEDCCPVKEDK